MGGKKEGLSDIEVLIAVLEKLQKSEEREYKTYIKGTKQYQEHKVRCEKFLLAINMLNEKIDESNPQTFQNIQGFYVGIRDALEERTKEITKKKRFRIKTSDDLKSIKIVKEMKEQWDNDCLDLFIELLKSKENVYNLDGTFNLEEYGYIISGGKENVSLGDKIFAKIYVEIGEYARIRISESIDIYQKNKKQLSEDIYKSRMNYQVCDEESFYNKTITNMDLRFVNPKVKLPVLWKNALEDIFIQGRVENQTDRDNAKIMKANTRMELREIVLSEMILSIEVQNHIFENILKSCIQNIRSHSVELFDRKKKYILNDKIQCANKKMINAYKIKFGKSELTKLWVGFNDINAHGNQQEIIYEISKVLQDNVYKKWGLENIIKKLKNEFPLSEDEKKAIEDINNQIDDIMRELINVGKSELLSEEKMLDKYKKKVRESTYVNNNKIAYNKYKEIDNNAKKIKEMLKGEWKITSQYSKLNKEEKKRQDNPLKDYEKLPANMPMIDMKRLGKGKSQSVIYYFYDEIVTQVLLGKQETTKNGKITEENGKESNEEVCGLSKAFFRKRKEGGNSFKACNPKYFVDAISTVERLKEEKIKNSSSENQIKSDSINILVKDSFYDMTGFNTCLLIIDKIVDYNAGCFEKNACDKYNATIRKFAEVLAPYQIALGGATAGILRTVFDNWSKMDEYKNQTVDQLLYTLIEVLESIPVTELVQEIEQAVFSEFLFYRSIKCVEYIQYEDIDYLLKNISQLTSEMNGNAYLSTGKVVQLNSYSYCIKDECKLLRDKLYGEPAKENVTVKLFENLQKSLIEEMLNKREKDAAI